METPTPPESKYCLYCERMHPIESIKYATITISTCPEVAPDTIVSFRMASSNGCRPTRYQLITRMKDGKSLNVRWLPAPILRFTDRENDYGHTNR
jgi:hypothetical protein